MDKYYYILITYDLRRSSGHVVKAPSLQEARDIPIKFGLSTPMNSNDIKKVYPKELDLTIPEDIRLIERRLRGVGGSIWYAENGELKTETDNINNKK
jgi:hypothetical protein